MNDPRAAAPAHLRPAVRRLLAPAAWIHRADTDELAEDVAFDLDEEGTIVAIHVGAAPAAGPPIVEHMGRVLLSPGLVNAHSHAFQRAIRGATQRRATGDPSDFWSWRTAMYARACTLDPDQVYEVTHACYTQMLAAGITCVGEFHYLHHQPDGRPYASANRLGEAVVAAAKNVGLRMTLLQVAYARAGQGKAALPEQRRFCDANVQTYLARVEAARAELGDANRVRVGLAPHSIRALPAEDLQAIARHANAEDLVVHAHVSEQVRENDACQTEHACTPTQLLDRCGLLDRPGRFTAVHAIHLSEADYALLAAHQVCACPSTEADLGDGVVPADRLRDAGAGLCLGSDSNARVDLVAEAGAMEMNLRVLRQRRLVLADTQGAVAPTLARTATRGGALALGWPELGRLAVGKPFDVAAFDLESLHLRGLAAARAFDALWTGGDAALCTQTWVQGVRLR